jgi:hypothetical protein
VIDWMPPILCVAGLELLALEIRALRANLKRAENLLPMYRHFWMAGTSALGLALAWASLYARYDLRPDLKVFGIPFLTAVFQLERGAWLDFTGPLTPPAFLGNVAVAFLLPQLFVAAIRRK